MENGKFWPSAESKLQFFLHLSQIWRTHRWRNDDIDINGHCRWLKPNVCVCLWLVRSHQMYYMFGFLFLVFIILIVTCSETAILLCYFHLCAEVSSFSVCSCWVGTVIDLVDALWYLVHIHCESKKRDTTLVYSFAKYWPIFKILSPSDLARNLQ